jgi:hypothetical protein
LEVLNYWAIFKEENAPIQKPGFLRKSMRETLDFRKNPGFSALGYYFPCPCSGHKYGDRFHAVWEGEIDRFFNCAD